MMKTSSVSVLCLLFAVNVFAVDFSSLSREKAVGVGFSAEKNCNVSFLLNIKSLKENRLDIFLSVHYVIGTDTLNDYIYLDESYSGMIKEIYLEAGDSIYAYILLNNEEVAKIDNLKGSLVAKAGTSLDMQSTADMSKFTGTVWKDDQLPLFRIAKADEKAQLLHVDVSLTENFEFDKLYLKIKVISPSQGILLYSKELAVTEETVLPYRRKVISVDFPDLDIQKPGSYYVQVFHQMGQSRINGVEFVSYRLTDK